MQLMEYVSLPEFFLDNLLVENFCWIMKIFHLCRIIIILPLGVSTCATVYSYVIFVFTKVCNGTPLSCQSHKAPMEAGLLPINTNSNKLFADFMIRFSRWNLKLEAVLA